MSTDGRTGQGRGSIPTCQGGGYFSPDTYNELIWVKRPNVNAERRIWKEADRWWIGSELADFEQFSVYKKEFFHCYT